MCVCVCIHIKLYRHTHALYITLYIWFMIHAVLHCTFIPTAVMFPREIRCENTPRSVRFEPGVSSSGNGNPHTSNINNDSHTILYSHIGGK